MKLINIGFGSMVSPSRLVAVVGPDSAPIRRIIQDAREHGRLVDASYGRKTRAVLIMDSGHVFLSALSLETMGQRLSDPVAEESVPDEQDDEAEDEEEL